MKQSDRKTASTEAKTPAEAPEVRWVRPVDGVYSLRVNGIILDGAGVQKVSTANGTGFALSIGPSSIGTFATMRDCQSYVSSWLAANPEHIPAGSTGSTGVVHKDADAAMAAAFKAASKQGTSS